MIFPWQYKRLLKKSNDDIIALEELVKKRDEIHKKDKESLGNTNVWQNKQLIILENDIARLKNEIAEISDNANTHVRKLNKRIEELLKQKNA